MKKIVLIVALVFCCFSCSKDNEDKNIIDEPVIVVPRDTIVSLQNDFSAICYLESGKRYTLDSQDASIQIDTAKVLISLINNSRSIEIKDYFSSNDKRHVAPNAFTQSLTKLGKLSNEYIGIGVDYFIVPVNYYLMIDNYNVLFTKYLMNAGVRSRFQNIDCKKVKYGDEKSYTLVDRKTFGDNYKEFVSNLTEDGTWEFNSGYKLFFNEPGYIICELVTSTGVASNGNVLGSHRYVLKYKIHTKI